MRFLTPVLIAAVLVAGIARKKEPARTTEVVAATATASKRAHAGGIRGVGRRPARSRRA